MAQENKYIYDKQLKRMLKLPVMERPTPQSVANMYGCGQHIFDEIEWMFTPSFMRPANYPIGFRSRETFTKWLDEKIVKQTEAYNNWLSSQPIVLNEDDFEDGKEYEEGKDFVIEYQLGNKEYWKPVLYQEFKNPLFTRKRIVALPKKEYQKNLLKEIMKKDEELGLYDNK